MTKTGTVKSVQASGSGSSATIHYPDPVPNGTDEVWTDPSDRIWDVLVSAKTSGGQVEITYDDTVQPPVKTGAKAL